jgi:hypothetical protein
MLPGEAGTAVQPRAFLRGDQAGAGQILRARAGGGDWHPARELAGRLAQHGDLDGLRAVQNRMDGVRRASGADATSSVP